MLIGVPLCPFAAITHHPCPGCGMTRATLALLGGHFGDAVRLHPLAPLLAPLVIAAFGYGAVEYVVRGRAFTLEAVRGPWVTVGALALTVLLLGVWIARFFGALGGPVPV